ncbi:hypothetical protein [Streptomyces chryseus]|uniref:hypothetical protein n=1 Tax=Streptomyces chryseus TaxID=68186 RepID=UPI001678D761|nr:hypothetical protein [Streptomyces chryseus]GGX07131.1 hypothetical protein GCM10010353_23250 [Streptomyces chryseus]
MGIGSGIGVTEKSGTSRLVRATFFNSPSVKVTPVLMTGLLVGVGEVEVEVEVEVVEVEVVEAGAGVDVRGFARLPLPSLLAGSPPHAVVRHRTAAAAAAAAVRRAEGIERTERAFTPHRSCAYDR